MLSSLLHTVIGGGLVISGYLLANKARGKKDKRLALYCADIQTISASIEDPWDYQLEPCTNYASVIIGSRSLCEDHFEGYLTDMIKKTEGD